MRVRCVDGYIREFIPMTGVKYPIDASKDFNHNRFVQSNSPAYCDHCRAILGFIDVKSEEARKHTCNKHYVHENNVKRLNR
jgi:hypothetical protein